MSNGVKYLAHRVHALFDTVNIQGEESEQPLCILTAW